MEAMAQISSKKLTKRMVQEITSSFSEELSPGFSKEVLEESSSAAHVTTFADCVAFVNTLQRDREEFDSLLQHMSESYKALFADVGKKATLDKYMELQLRWRQGLRKCECGFLKVTEDAQVEEDQEHPTFSVVSNDWASLLLAHDVNGREGLAGLARHSLLIIFQHLGTAVWDFMQKSVLDKKVESGKHFDADQTTSS